MDKCLAVPPIGPSTVPASLHPRAARLAAGESGLMFFLLRMAFWLGLVLILLPSGTSQPGPAVSDVGASDAISAASATVSDVRGFCSRQPDACSVGSQVAAALGYKAQAGAKMIYEFLTQAVSSHSTGSLATGSGSRGAKTVSDREPADKASQNTLNPADLQAPWRGPPARKDPKHAA